MITGGVAHDPHVVITLVFEQREVPVVLLPVSHTQQSLGGVHIQAIRHTTLLSEVERQSVFRSTLCLQARLTTVTVTIGLHHTLVKHIHVVAAPQWTGCLVIDGAIGIKEQPFVCMQFRFVTQVTWHPVWQLRLTHMQDALGPGDELHTSVAPLVLTSFLVSYEVFVRAVPLDTDTGIWLGQSISGHRPQSVPHNLHS